MNYLARVWPLTLAGLIGCNPWSPDAPPPSAQGTVQLCVGSVCTTATSPTPPAITDASTKDTSAKDASTKDATVGSGASSGWSCVVGDAGLQEQCSLPPPSPGLQIGDQTLVSILVTDAALSQGSAVTGTVTLAGPLAFTNDAGSASVQAVTFTEGTVLELPVLVRAPGSTAVTANIEGEPIAVVTTSALAPLLGITSGSFAGPVGLGARNSFVLCATATSGTVALRGSDDAGVIDPSTVWLAPSQGQCPAGYQSSATFFWTGTGTVAAAVATLPDSGISEGLVASALGTTTIAWVSQAPNSQPSWACELDAGWADAGTQSTNPCTAGLNSMVGFLMSVTRPAVGIVGDASLPATGAVVQLIPTNGVSIVGTLAPVNAKGLVPVVLMQNATTHLPTNLQPIVDGYNEAPFPAP